MATKVAPISTIIFPHIVNSKMGFVSNLCFNPLCFHTFWQTLMWQHCASFLLWLNGHIHQIMMCAACQPIQSTCTHPLLGMNMLAESEVGFEWESCCNSISLFFPKQDVRWFLKFDNPIFFFCLIICLHFLDMYANDSRSCWSHFLCFL